MLEKDENKNETLKWKKEGEKTTRQGKKKLESKS